MQDRKILTLRLDRQTWSFLKKRAVDRDMSLQELINDCLEKYKKKCENKLTSSDVLVS